MNTPEQKPEQKMDARSNDTATKLPGFDLLARSDLMLWPYRSMAKALLRTHNDLAAYVEANRKLADEMRDIFRREQDLVLEIAEKTLKRASDAVGEGKAMMTTGHMEELYDSAVAGVRELGRAVADAQVRSIESLRNHARTSLGQAAAETEKKPREAA